MGHPGRDRGRREARGRTSPGPRQGRPAAPRPAEPDPLPEPGPRSLRTELRGRGARSGSPVRCLYLSCSKPDTHGPKELP